MVHGQAQIVPPYNPEQTLLPPSPVDCLSENHLMFFLLDLAAELYLEANHAVYLQKDSRGEKAYDARMMVLLQLCQKAGLVSLGQVALDGTEVKANASKQKSRSH